MRDKKGRFIKGMSTWNKGKKGYHIHTEEWRKKHGEEMRKLMIGRKLSNETIAKIKLSNTGKKASEETKLKMSLSHKGKINSGMFKKGQESWTKGLTLRKNKYKIPKVYKFGKEFSESHMVWTHHFGNLPYVPRGFIIHHIDVNPENNDGNNLFLMPLRDHNLFHGEFFREFKNLKQI